MYENFDRELNNELLKNKPDLDDITANYWAWLSLLGEYTYLSKPTSAERVAYRQNIATLLPKNMVGLTDYVQKGILTAELAVEIEKQKPYTPVKHLLLPLEERYSQLWLVGSLYEQRVFNMLQTFDFTPLATSEFNLVAELSFNYKTKTKQMEKIVKLRQLCKEKFSGKIKIKSTVGATTAKLKANLPPEYAPMLRNLLLSKDGAEETL